MGRRSSRCWPSDSGATSAAAVAAVPLALFVCLAFACVSQGGQVDAGKRRGEMIEQQIRERGVTDARVLEAMRKVPRERFVPADQADRAYDDTPLPIGFGQTISQPYIVAHMTETLGVSAGHRVLEVGTGSGYQAAVLAEIVDRVYSVELIEALGRTAAERLAAMGYGNVELRIGDGYAGWPEKAPFDGVVVTAAAPEVPPALVQQLKPGGRMVIPVGGRDDIQYLKLLVRRADGGYDEKRVLPVRFVPLVPGKK
jgi:protein-L-isoaspartate(D-aspartate) O-methyltransferase